MCNHLVSLLMGMRLCVTVTGMRFRNETLCCMTGMSFYISIDIIACVKEFLVGNQVILIQQHKV